MGNGKAVRSTGKGAPTDPARGQTAGAAETPAIAAPDPAPLCRYEELAMRENHLRQAAARRIKPAE